MAEKGTALCLQKAFVMLWLLSVYTVSVCMLCGFHSTSPFRYKFEQIILLCNKHCYFILFNYFYNVCIYLLFNLYFLNSGPHVDLHTTYLNARKLACFYKSYYTKQIHYHRFPLYIIAESLSKFRNTAPS